MERGEHTQAVVCLQENVAADPHFKTLELLGECLIVLGRLQESIVPLAAATTLNKGVRAPALLAEVFWHLNQFHDAKEVAEIALGRDPRNRKAYTVWDNINKLKTQTVVTKEEVAQR